MESNILKVANRNLTLLGYVINAHFSTENLQNIITPTNINYSYKGKIYE